MGLFKGGFGWRWKGGPDMLARIMCREYFADS